MHVAELVRVLHLDSSPEIPTRGKCLQTKVHLEASDVLTNGLLTAASLSSFTPVMFSHGQVGILASPNMLLLGLAIALAALFCIAVYRLTLHPLAGVPGPRLAAISGLYEVYFQLLKDGGGRYWVVIERMHKTYGERKSLLLRRSDTADPTIGQDPLSASIPGRFTSRTPTGTPSTSALRKHPSQDGTTKASARL